MLPDINEEYASDGRVFEVTVSTPDLMINMHLFNSKREYAFCIQRNISEKFSLSTT
jgi:hypothetical protein